MALVVVVRLMKEQQPFASVVLAPTAAAVAVGGLVVAVGCIVDASAGSA